jgi:hypothetical protein
MSTKTNFSSCVLLFSGKEENMKKERPDLGGTPTPLVRRGSSRYVSLDYDR